MAVRLPVSIDGGLSDSAAQNISTVLGVGAIVCCLITHIFGGSLSGGEETGSAGLYAFLLPFSLTTALVSSLFGIGRMPIRLAVRSHSALYAAMIGILAISLYGFALFAEAATTPIVAAIAALLGCGFALFTCVWMAIGDNLSSHEWARNLIVSFALTALLVFLVSLAPAAVRIALALGMMATAGVALTARRSLRRVSKPADPAMNQNLRRAPPIRAAGASLLLGLIFGFTTNQFFRPFSTSLDLCWVFAAALAGSLISAGLLFLPWHMSGKGLVDGFFGMNVLPIPMIFAFVPFDHLGDYAMIFTVVAFTLTLSILATVMPVLIKECARLLGTSLQSLMTLCGCAALLGFCLGIPVNVYSQASQHVLLFGLAPGLCLLLGIVACDVLFSHIWFRRHAIRKAVLFEQDARLEAADSSILRGCHNLSERHSLTSRESEVLYVLAQGYSLARVSEILTITKGTATTHARHIYGKLGVHTKSELIDLVKDNSD